MDDESTPEEKLERVRRFGENLRDTLQDGDEFLLQFVDGEVRIGVSRFSRLRAGHPRLYGRLMSLEAQLEGGCAAYAFAAGAGAAFVFGLQVGWWEGLIGQAAVDKLSSWWAYLVLAVALFVLVSLYYDWMDKWVYRRARPELLELLREEGLDRDILLTMLDGETGLDKATRQLKLDPGPFDKPRGSDDAPPCLR